MSHWVINIDRDFVREGFDPTELEAEGIEVTRAERLSEETVFIIVLTYVGGKILDHVSDGSLEAATKKIWAFVSGKNRRLRVEVEERGFDPRVQLVAAKIDSLSQAEFETALRSLPTTRRHSERVLDAAGEDLKDLWYVWKDGRWSFSYYTTASNDIVDSVEFDPYDGEVEIPKTEADV